MAEPFQSASWHRVAALTPKLRSHGRIGHHRYRGQSWYVIHDPLSGRVHRFTPVAYAFIRAMDGQRTVDEIWTGLASQLEVHAPSQDDIIRLLSQLFEADLLSFDRLPNAEALLQIVNRHRRTHLKTALRNPLSITLPLWDPDTFLDHTVARIEKVITAGGLLAWLVWVVPAIVLAVLHGTELTSNVTDRVLSTENLLLLALIFPVVKLLHELGHAYALKALGGEVHQIGVMLIAFYPVPYVDASAAAMLPRRWHRILVSAAGMMVELILAAGAVYVWLLAEPGWVRAAAFDVIFIAGISTLIVNGNPLLRFDGYFILSDLIEIPNLAQRSSRFWGRLTTQRLFGLRTRDTDAASPGERAWFVFYGPAAFLYRMLVLISLSLFIATEFFILGVVMAIVALTMATVVPLVRGGKRILHTAQLQAASRSTRWKLAAMSVVLMVALFIIPVPLHTTTEGVVWLPDEAYVRAGADGFVARVLARPGTRVEKGVPLFESQDPFLATQIELNRHRRQELETRLISERFANRVLAEITKVELSEASERLASEVAKAGRLTARSERSGIFIVPQAEDLPGRYFRKGEVIGYVLPDATDTIRGVVSQDNIDLVRQKLRAAEVVLASNIGTPVPARIIREVPSAGDEAPSKALTVGGGGVIAADPKDSKGIKVAHRLFQIDLELATALSAPAFGARAYIRFEHHPEPLSVQVYRRIRQLFLSRFNA